MADYSVALADASLDIGAISLNPENPFTWASGFRMPIYNDNRRHLRYPDNRRMITAAFIEKIKQERIPVDFVTGTSTSGIAPAASLAQELRVPLGILRGDLAEIYTPEVIQDMLGAVPGGDYDIVMSTCPSSIIPAVCFANERNLPFAYVRQKPKSHGLQQQIEGELLTGERVLLLDFYSDDETYFRSAEAAIMKAGGIVHGIMSAGVSGDEFDVTGRNGLHVEDLISTGGSCMGEINEWRRRGAKVRDCLAIFSYDFPDVLRSFAEADCNLGAILGYEGLLRRALEKGKIQSDQHDMLREWREDPFKWGEKHGFPPVKKES